MAKNVRRFRADKPSTTWKFSGNGQLYIQLPKRKKEANVGGQHLKRAASKLEECWISWISDSFVCREATGVLPDLLQTWVCVALAIEESGDVTLPSCDVAGIWAELLMDGVEWKLKTGWKPFPNTEDNSMEWRRWRRTQVVTRENREAMDNYLSKCHVTHSHSL